MYKCACGNIFDDPVRSVSDYHSEVGGWPEYEYICPVCGETDFDEAFECSECGEVKVNNERYPGDICDECAHKLQEQFETIFFGFTKNQRSCIRFFIEGGII